LSVELNRLLLIRKIGANISFNEPHARAVSQMTIADHLEIENSNQELLRIPKLFLHFGSHFGRQ
jgi:hypothetical protein